MTLPNLKLCKFIIYIINYYFQVAVFIQSLGYLVNLRQIATVIMMMMMGVLITLTVQVTKRKVTKDIITITVRKK